MALSLIFDLAVVIILLVSAGVSFFRGVIREVLTIFGFLGGILAAFFLGGALTPMVMNFFNIEKDTPNKLFGMVPYDIVATVATYGGIFLAVFLILQLASYFISSAANAIGLGPVDRTLGVFFGLARGVLLLGFLYLPFHFILPDENKENWFGSSKAFVYIESTSKWLSGFSPFANEPSKPDDTNTTREILQDIDVLKDPSDKPKSKSDITVQQPSDAESYSDEQRQKLDTVIKDNEQPPTDKAE